MLAVEKINMLDAINKTQLDTAVGIQIALLWEDASKCYYGTSIAPHKSISAHFHNEGDELYFIVSGNGCMRLGEPISNGVDWKQELKIYSGEIFNVPPKTIHQLTNNSDNALIVVFGCDKSHLSTDRIIVDI